ncbi:hypothetical protein TVAG_432160 [Trichomonas vaginalis G3]|uniref:Uncharacterized protein n=1 Tax=Trichomonas vaginalis (strain ATCC PRA-98 / G3) TaxID=412133 RepID=A2F8T0_TRIV3|nr:hypothetical protein TVAGG3_0126430 [Trichomonas vaginalis G3]EAX98666.1 hypothetical protein TVAG_432160 [Trichomonas vaginalis G3]KAI5545794.1 hypothetical protein TVAGG3_0126430 [Trichomonas vaginalis G3]|eukprot:XP_001311596.1 hypothetical protein [Trichomonas vaginalis G3]
MEASAINMHCAQSNSMEKGMYIHEQTGTNRVLKKHSCMDIIAESVIEDSIMNITRSKKPQTAKRTTGGKLYCCIRG